MPVWVRGAESAEILSPFPQKLAVAALGYSGSTGARGHHRPDRLFRQRRCAARRARQRGARQDRLHRPSHDADPGRLGLRPVRRAAAPGPDHRLARRARSAIVVRSIGTDHHRNPHTGVQYFTDGAQPIPAGALDRPRRRAAGPHPQARQAGDDAPDPGQRRRRDGGHSGNVIAEVPGRDPKPRRSCWSAAISTAGTSAPARSTMAPASRSRPPRPSTSWTPGARCARSASSGSAPRSRAASAARAYAKAPRPASATPSPAKAISAPTASGASPRKLIDDRSRRLRPTGRRARPARHRQERQGRSRRHRCRADDRGRRAVDLAQPGRHPLFRLPPHARRHARQDRSRPAPPECRRLDRRCSRSSSGGIEPEPKRR